MAYDLQSVLTAISSDKMLTLSAASFVEKRTKSASDLLNAAESVMADEATASGLVGAIPVSFPSLNKDGGYSVINSVDFLNALENDQESMISNGKEFDVDVVLEDLTTSIAGSYAAAEALRTVSESYAKEDNSASLISNFTSRLQLKFSGLTPAASNYGYIFLETLSSQSLTARDKVMAIFSVLGVNETQSYNGVGVPSSTFNDITGSNVWTAWGAEVASSNVVTTVVNAGKNVINGLGKITTAALSPLYKKVKKVVNVYTTVQDSFKSDKDGNFNGFSDYGTTFKLAKVTFNYTDPLVTILDWTKYYVKLIANDINAVVTDDILSNLQIIDPTATTIEEGVDHLWSSYSTSHLTRSGEILVDLIAVQDIIYSIEYPNASFFDKLSADRYLVFELPGSQVYCWLVGSDVYIDFQWKIIGKANLPGVTSTDPGAWLEAIAAMKYNDVDAIDTDVKMYDAIKDAKLATITYLWWSAIYTGRIDQQTYMDYAEQVGYAFTKSGYTPLSSPPSVNNLDLAKLLSGSADGSFITDSTSNSTRFDIFENMLFMLFGQMTSGQYYASYYYSSSQDIGKYQVMTDAALADYVTYALVGAVIAAVSIAALKGIMLLAKKAWIMGQYANTVTFNAISTGNATPENLNLLYKLSRRANRFGLIATGLSGSTSSLLTMSAAASNSSIINGILGNGNTISGGKSIYDVYKTIK